MQRDPIVEETRAIREAYAAQFAFDLKAIARDLQEESRRTSRQTVTLAPRPAREDDPVPAPR